MTLGYVLILFEISVKMMMKRRPGMKAVQASASIDLPNGRVAVSAVSPEEHCAVPRLVANGYGVTGGSSGLEPTSSHL